MAKITKKYLKFLKNVKISFIWPKGKFLIFYYMNSSRPVRETLRQLGTLRLPQILLHLRDSYDYPSTNT